MAVILPGSCVMMGGKGRWVQTGKEDAGTMRRHHILPLLTLLCMGPALADNTDNTDDTVDAVTPDKAREACIDSQRINGWTSESDRVIIVTLGARQRYRVELGPSAGIFDVDSQPALAFIPRSDGSLCAGWGHVGVEGRRIPILSITRLPDPPPRMEQPAPSEK